MARQIWRSEAGHHSECPHPFDDCICIRLWERDRLESDDLPEVPFYSEGGWPYDDDG